MESAEEYLRGENLPECLKTLQDSVRKDPSNSKHRIFLFQLLSVLGQWDRALTQLNVVGDLEASALPMVQAYREALQSEALRAEIFNGNRSPLVFGKPEHWVALLINSMKLTAEGKIAESQDLRAEAFEEAFVTSGTINGKEFEWVADADPRMGPCLEAIVAGNYYWIPLNRIKTITLDPPEDLRDYVWTPAYFTWSNGGQMAGFIPTRYPGSESVDDSKVKLSKKTEWLDKGSDLFLGLGQRILATDADEYPLMDVREIYLNTKAEEDEA